MVAAASKNYYQTHEASADYLYKVLMGGEEEARMSPVTDVVNTVVNGSGNSAPSITGGIFNESYDSGGSDGSLGGDTNSTANTGSTNNGGLGLGSVAGAVASTVASMGMSMMGAPAAVGYGVGQVAKGVADEGFDEDSVASIGLGMAGRAAFGAPFGYAVTAYNVAKALADYMGLTNIGAVFGPSDDALGYSAAVVGDIGRTTAADESETEAQTTSEPSVSPQADFDMGYTGPKAGEDASDSDSDTDSDTNADGNSTGGGASSSSSSGPGANGGEDGGASDGNSW